MIIVLSVTISYLLVPDTPAGRAGGTRPEDSEGVVQLPGQDGGQGGEGGQGV